MRNHKASMSVWRLLPVLGALLGMTLSNPSTTHAAPQPASLSQVSLPILLLPSNGSTTADLTPSFDWEDVFGADHYRIQIDDNDDFDSPAADSQPTNSTYTPSNTLPNGTYYWHVRANDGMGNWGDYSDVWTFTVNGALPAAPTLLTPPNNSTTSDLTPTFDWEDVPGATHYRIQIADNPDFSSPTADSQPSNSTYTPGKTLPNGSYYWRVRTNDEMGNWGEYSEIWTFTVNGALPAAPTLLTPPNSSTTSDLTPTFDWEDVPGATHYRIQIADNPDFSSPAADSQPTNSIYTPSNTLPNGTYYWHVRANDGMGNWGEYSEVWTFTVNGALPAAPTLLTPPNGSTTSDLTPTFDWEDVPGSAYYRIQVDNNADFSSPAADSQPTNSTYTPSNSLPNGTYYWHVRVNDGLGNWGEYSPAWKLNINGVLPPAPTLLSPANGSATSDLTPTFDWEDVSGADHYHIQVDDNADFSSPSADSQPTNSTYTPSNSLPNGTYYWHVRANDGMGNWGEYSTSWKLNINGVLPPAPTLLSPANGSTTADLTPTFDWEDVSGADHYRIQVDDNADFSSPAADSQPTSSTYTPSKPLANGTYYWRVRTNDGNWGEYSPAWKLNINGVLPPAPTLLYPANGSTTADLTPLFDWEDVSGADHYRIQVDDNADFSSPAADSQPTGSTYTPSKPLANGTYYWHVRTNDGMGNWGDYSPAWTVCVDGVLPPAPTLLAPANSSTTADITPSFDWEDVPGADHYRIQVDDNADFSSPAADSEPTRSIYTPNKPLSNGTYYWRVRTNDGMGNWGDYSPVWIVYVDGVLPPAPTLLAPANSSTTSDFTPPFDWEDVENAARYRIQIDDNTDFSSTVADAQPTRSTYTPRKTLPNGTYYWRVRTGDSMGNWGEYSPAWKVTVEAELLSSIEVSAEPTATASPTVQPQPIPPSLLASPPASDISSTSTTKPVYLTFDDGPDPFYTPQLVAFLQQQGVQATFFINGADRNNSWGGIYFTCQSGPGDLVPIASLDGERVVELIDKGGFGVGLHGWYHGSIAHPEDLWHSNTFDIRTNIIQQEQALNNLGISFEPLLRAPGGPFPATPFPEYRDWYYYGWDIDAHDGYGVSPQTIIDNVLDGLSDAPDYPIILLHAGRPNTLQAIVDSRYDLLGKIKALGYTDFGLLPRPIDRTGYPPNGSIYTVAH